MGSFIQLVKLIHFVIRFSGVSPANIHHINPLLVNSLSKVFKVFKLSSIKYTVEFLIAVLNQLPAPVNDSMKLVLWRYILFSSLFGESLLQLSVPPSRFKKVSLLFGVYEFCVWVSSLILSFKVTFLVPGWMRQFLKRRAWKKLVCAAHSQ